MGMDLVEETKTAEAMQPRQRRRRLQREKQAGEEKQALRTMLISCSPR
jgi:hypothetical protein